MTSNLKETSFFIEKIDALIIISMFIIAFLIRLAGVPKVFNSWDEYAYWIKAAQILENNWIPAKEVFEYPSPFLSYILAGIILLFGGELNTLRISSVIFGSLTVPLVYIFGKAMYDRRTGFLSALFLCFQEYHILFSRIIMLEAFTLVFITLFLYFFWLSQRSIDSKNTTYAIIAGAMLGLAIDAKYLPALFIPAILIYALWIGRFKFKALMDRRIILTIVFALLLFAPMVILWFYSGANLDPLFFSAVGKFQNPSGPSNTRMLSIPIDALLKRVEVGIIGLFSRGADKLNHVWNIMFVASAVLLLILTFLFYLPDLIKRDKRTSFLMVMIISITIPLMALTPAVYYLLYDFPLYFVMLSHFAIESFDHLRRENNYKNIFRIFIILLTAIMLFSYFTTSVTSPFWEKGELSWIKSDVNYIQSDITKSGYKENVLIGWTSGRGYINYALDFFSDLNATTVIVVKNESSELKCSEHLFFGFLLKGSHCGSKNKKQEIPLDLVKINMLKPDYLIMREYQFDSMLKTSDKIEILKDYKIVYHSKIQYISDCDVAANCGIVLKRKNMQSLGLQIDGKKGTIDEDLFKKSVPSVMKVGNVYTAIVRIKNTGDSQINFRVATQTNKFVLFVDDVGAFVTLDPGSTHTFKFKLIPLIAYTGDFPITVDLYSSDANNETQIPFMADSVSANVRLIKRAPFEIVNHRNISASRIANGEVIW